MLNKKNFKSNQILEKKFRTEISGYSAREVDEYLDQILEDYRKYEEEVEVLSKHIEDRNIKVQQHKEKNEALQLELENTLELLKQAKASKNIDIAEELKVMRKQIDKLKG